MNMLQHPASLEAAAYPCADIPDARILLPVSSLGDFPCVSGLVEPITTVCVVDTETTGFDPQHDQVIEIAAAMIIADARGRIVAIGKSGDGLRDPGVPLSSTITKLTGLTDDDVMGQSIDLDRLERFLRAPDVLIAHNAAFDAPFLERLMPDLAGRPWACSAKDFDWLEHGFDGCKLGHLLMQIGRYNSGHRAMADVVSLIHLLAHQTQNGRTVLDQLLEKARRNTFRLEARQAPFEKRSVLKSRGYRWDPSIKTWWTEVAEEELDAEQLWLQQQVNPWGPAPLVKPISWHERHR